MIRIFFLLLDPAFICFLFLLWTWCFAILTFHIVSLLENKSSGKISQGKCWMAKINKERRPHIEEATIPGSRVFLLNSVSFCVILIGGAMSVCLVSVSAVHYWSWNSARGRVGRAEDLAQHPSWILDLYSGLVLSWMLTYIFTFWHTSTPQLSSIGGFRIKKIQRFTLDSFQLHLVEANVSRYVLLRSVFCSAFLANLTRQMRWIFFFLFSVWRIKTAIVRNLNIIE